MGGEAVERADSFPVKHVKTFLTGPLLRRCLRGPGSGSAPCGERGQASLHFNFVLVLSPQQNLFSLLGFRIRCLCSDQQGPCGGWSHSLPHGGASWRCCWLPGLGWSPCCTPTPLSSPSPPPISSPLTSSPGSAPSRGLSAALSPHPCASTSTLPPGGAPSGPHSHRSALVYVAEAWLTLSGAETRPVGRSKPRCPGRCRHCAA